MGTARQNIGENGALSNCIDDLKKLETKYKRTLVSD